MADFILIDECVNYNNWLTYYWDLKLNKKSSYTWNISNKNDVLTSLCYSYFIRDNDIQPILLEFAVSQNLPANQVFYYMTNGISNNQTNYQYWITNNAANLINSKHFSNIFYNLLSLDNSSITTGLTHTTITNYVFANASMTYTYTRKLNDLSDSIKYSYYDTVNVRNRICDVSAVFSNFIAYSGTANLLFDTNMRTNYSKLGSSVTLTTTNNAKRLKYYFNSWGDTNVTFSGSNLTRNRIVTTPLNLSYLSSIQFTFNGSPYIMMDGSNLTGTNSSNVWTFNLSSYSGIHHIVIQYSNTLTGVFSNIKGV